MFWSATKTASYLGSGIIALELSSLELYPFGTQENPSQSHKVRVSYKMTEIKHLFPQVFTSALLVVKRLHRFTAKT